MDNYFNDLYAVNVNGRTEKKNGLTYLSWAWAWGEIKKAIKSGETVDGAHIEERQKVTVK